MKFEVTSTIGENEARTSRKVAFDWDDMSIEWPDVVEVLRVLTLIADGTLSPVDMDAIRSRQEVIPDEK